MLGRPGIRGEGGLVSLRLEYVLSLSFNWDDCHYIDFNP